MKNQKSTLDQFNETDKLNSHISYNDYKNMDYEQFEKIPAEWDVYKLKQISDIFPSNVDKKEKEDEPTIYLCNYTDVYNNSEITPDLDFMKATAKKSDIQKFRLEEGDVIITKDSEAWDDIGIPAYVAHTMDNVICGYHLTHLKPDASTIIGKYLYYFLESEIGSHHFHAEANGVTRYGISINGIKEAPVTVPSKEEQKAIVQFVDRETHHIRNLIEQKEQLIDLLEEKRTSLIDDVVTNGLEDDVEQKETGISWLGEIPKHWDIKRLKFCANINPSHNEINTKKSDTEVSFLPMECVSEQGEIIQKETAILNEVIDGYTYFKEGDILIAKITPCFENGKGALANGVKNRIGFGTTEFVVVRPFKELNNKYFHYITISDTFRKIGTGQMKGAAGQKRVPDEFFQNYPQVLPPKKEQIAIVEYLDRETQKIDDLVSKIDEGIKRLKEYRTALITDVVTGQIDVRGEV